MQKADSTELKAVALNISIVENLDKITLGEYSINELLEE